MGFWRWLVSPGDDGVSPILYILFWFFTTLAIVGFMMVPYFLLLGGR